MLCQHLDLPSVCRTCVALNVRREVVGGAELGEGITTFLARDEVVDATVQADSVRRDISERDP